MSSEDKIRLGKSIRALRKSSGLNQTELSELLNVKQSSVSRWESGVDLPTIYNMSGLVKIFGCTYNDLLRPQEALTDGHLEMTKIFNQLSEEQRAALITIAKFMLTEQK